MRHTLNLQSRLDLPPLDFEWDEAAGELSGASAPTVRQMVARAVREGYIEVYPIPASIPATDPLKSREQMAALLGGAYELPAWLRAHYPVLPEDPDLDELNGVQVVY